MNVPRARDDRFSFVEDYSRDVDARSSRRNHAADTRLWSSTETNKHSRLKRTQPRQYWAAITFRQVQSSTMCMHISVACSSYGHSLLSCVSAIDKPTRGSLSCAAVASTLSARDTKKKQHRITTG